MIKMRIGTAQWKENSQCREDRILHWEFFIISRLAKRTAH